MILQGPVIPRTGTQHRRLPSPPTAWHKHELAWTRAALPASGLQPVQGWGSALPCMAAGAAGNQSAPKIRPACVHHLLYCKGCPKQAPSCTTTGITYIPGL